MTDQFEYRTLHVDLQSTEGTVLYDSHVGDLKTVGRTPMPLAAYLNSPDVGPAGWEVCGFVMQPTHIIIMLKQRQHT